MLLFFSEDLNAKFVGFVVSALTLPNEILVTGNGALFHLQNCFDGAQRVCRVTRGHSFPRSFRLQRIGRAHAKVLETKSDFFCMM